MADQLLFEKDEWDEAMRQLVREMTEYLAAFRAPVFEDFGTHGGGWGSGAYLQLGQRVFLLTNDHVATARKSGRQLAYQFAGQEDLRRVAGNHVSFGAPLDLALLPVDTQAWAHQSNQSRAITVDQIASYHAPVQGEVLTLVGFAGENVDFHFGAVTAKAICWAAQEAALPEDERFFTRFHFGIDYKPDLATDVVAKEGLPRPPGLSGAAVWNTCFVEAKMAGKSWKPELAKVTGVVWGWPSDVGCLIATRAEYLRSFLLGAVGNADDWASQLKA